MAEKVDKLKGVSTDMVPGLMAIISAMNLTKDQVTTLQTKVAEKVEDFDTLKKGNAGVCKITPTWPTS